MMNSITNVLRERFYKDPLKHKTAATADTPCVAGEPCACDDFHPFVQGTEPHKVPVLEAIKAVLLEEGTR